MRYFVKRTQKTSRRSTVKRLNKRYPFVHPGKKYDRVAKVAISVDQSASITDELLTAFFSELEILAKIAEIRHDSCVQWLDSNIQDGNWRYHYRSPLE